MPNLALAVSLVTSSPMIAFHFSSEPQPMPHCFQSLRPAALSCRLSFYVNICGFLAFPLFTLAGKKS
ncbi:hypothetical protein K438DRAFT_453659 [Mycena galopus ATCC 62051]|nr:hypothetical protein K438DRAFT_453659 [Mycena galopus ATCC 62051]